MSRHRPVFGLLIAMLTVLPTQALACMTPSAVALASVADHIAQQIGALEDALPEVDRKPRPGILLSIAVEFGESEAAPDTPAQVRDALTRRACIDTARLGRNVAAALQERAASLRILSASDDADLATIATRIRSYGVGNMDHSSVSRLQISDINYVVMVGGRMRVSAKGCGFATDFLADIDVHSVATGQVVRAGDVRAEAEPAARNVTEAVHASVVAAAGNATFGTLHVEAYRPICLRNTEVTFDDDTLAYEAKWMFYGGCLSAGESRDFTPTASELSGNGWPANGEVSVTPQDKCGSMEFDSIPIRKYMMPTWTPPLPYGATVLACGTWGPTAFYVPSPERRCASGQAVATPCVAPYGGPPQYARVCQ